MKEYLYLKENNKLEVKRGKYKLPKSIWESYSAFANTDGGIILLGVSEDTNNNLIVTGIDDDSKVLDEFFSTLNNTEKVSKNILLDSDVLLMEHGDLKYIKINVPRATNNDKPIYLNNNLFFSYKRNHPGDYKCSKDEIHAMIRNQNSSYNFSPLLNFKYEDLSKETIKTYRTIFKVLKENHIWATLDDIEFLEKLGAIKIIDDIPYPTRTGLLFFGYDYKILDLYPLYFLDYQEQLANIINARYTFRINSGTGEWSGNVFDFYYRVISRLEMDLPNPFELESDNIHRKKETKLHSAVREALTNARVV